MIPIVDRLKKGVGMEKEYLGRVIGVVNQKGGVGKTTLTLMIASEMVDRGYRTLVIDNDPQASITNKFLDKNDLPEEIRAGGEPRGVAATLKLYSQISGDVSKVVQPLTLESGLDLIGTNDLLGRVNQGDSFEGPLLFKKNVGLLSQYYDYIIIDSGPNFGTIWTSTFLGASTGVIIPVLYDALSISAMDSAIKKMQIINSMSPDAISILGIVPMRYNTKMTLVEQESLKIARHCSKEFDVPILRGLPAYSKFVEAVDLNLSLKAWAGKHKSYSALKYTINQLEEIMDKKGEVA